MSKLSKDIQMLEVDERQNIVGTEIFDPSLPSDLDFHQDSHQSPKIQVNPQVSDHLTKIFISDQIKSFRVYGKANKDEKKPLYLEKTLINNRITTYKSKIYGQDGEGLRKFWQSITGYAKRQIHIDDGFLYIFQRSKDGLLLKNVYKLNQLFKIFVDPEEDKLRLIFVDDQKIVTKDLTVDNFIKFLEEIRFQLSKIGLLLKQ